MSHPVALLVGDPHIQRHAWRARPEIVGDADFALQGLVQLVKQYRPSWLILLGDVFDSYTPTPEDVAAVFAMARQVGYLGSRVGFLRGQHDLGRWSGRGNLPWLSLSHHCQHLHEVLIQVGPVRLYGLDFCREDALRQRLSTMKAHMDVLLAHQCWVEHMPPGSACEAALSSVPHVRLVATGDMHGHRATTLTGASGQTLTALSPGSLYMQSSDEDGSKYVFLLHEDLTFESLALPARTVLRATLRDEQELEQLLITLTQLQPDEQLPESLRQPLVFVRCLPGLPGAKERLEKVAQARAHLFFKDLLPRDSTATDERDETVLPRCWNGPVLPSLAELAQRRLREHRLSPELAPHVLRLASSLNPADEIGEVVEDLRRQLSGSPDAK